MTNLAHLARALTINMHLDRDADSLDYREMFSEGKITAVTLEQTSSQRSLPEMRSFLGCLYLISAKYVPFPWQSRA
jgi:hypothetical protein